MSKKEKQQDKLMQGTAEDMVKPGGGLKLLRKYLGDEAVDNWAQAYASDRDLPPGAPDVVNDAKAYSGKQKGLRRRGH